LACGVSFSLAAVFEVQGDQARRGNGGHKTRQDHEGNQH